MYKTFRMGGGLALKTAADAAPDNALTVCTFCGFDEIGTVTSARGRRKLNYSTAIGSSGDLLGGFDALLDGTKYRFLKRGTGVFYGDVDTTEPYDEDAVLYDTDIGALKPIFLGGTPATFSATATMSGFAYRDYAYFADGSGFGRYNIATPGTETWGLVSPGYHELSGTKEDPLSVNNSVTVTVDVDGGHGLRAGILDGEAYPFPMNLELVGVKSVGGIPENEINTMHSGYTGSQSANITVTDDGNDMVDGGTYTVEFVNELGGQGLAPLQIMLPDGSAQDLQGGSVDANLVQSGSDNPATNEIQSFVFTGTVTAGFWRLRSPAPGGGSGSYEYTPNMSFDQTVEEFQAALETFSWIGSQTAVTTVCTVTSSTQFTFDANTASTGGALTGGGGIGFMRQGPTCATTPNTGAIVGGEYRYAYTFYNGVAESNFSAQTLVAPGTNDLVTLTNVMVGPAGTTERRIYRSDVNGRQLYYLGKIENNTDTTYDDINKLPAGADHTAVPGEAVTEAEHAAASDSSTSRGKRVTRRSIQEAEIAAKAAEQKQREKLATNLGIQSSWVDHDPPPTDIKHVGMLGETMFFVTGADLGFSSPNNPEHCPLSNRVTPGRDVSETLQTWLAFDRDCIAYTSAGLYRLSQAGPSFEEARFEEIESPVGCAGEWAAAALDGQQGHLFLAKSGIYLFDGARVNEISYAIEPLFTDPTHADYIEPQWMQQAVMVTSRDRMYLSYRTGTTEGDNNRILLGDFQDTASPNFTVLSWEAVSMWRERSDNSLLAGDSNGFLWLMDSGWASAGAAIAWSLQTKEFALNDTKAFKVDEVVLDADFNGATTTVTVSARARGNDKSATFTSTATGRQRLKFKQPVWMKGEVVDVAVSSSAATKRALYAVGWTYTPIGEPMDEP